MKMPAIHLCLYANLALGASLPACAADATDVETAMEQWRELMTLESVHDYENALGVEDAVCTQIVDEFRITDNLASVLNSALSSATEAVSKALTRFVRTNQVTQISDSDKQKALEKAQLSAKQANWIPMELELRYGNQIHARRLQQSPEIIPREGGGFRARQYEKADSILASLLSEVGEEHAYEFQLFLTDDADSNAEAVPGGYIYLSSGALDRGLAELILGHEIAHITKRHTSRELQARLIESADSVDAIKELVRKDAKNNEAIAQQVAALPQKFLNYSRQQELQADACAIRIAASVTGLEMEASIDEYVAHLATAEGQQNLKASQHPPYEERRERMTQTLTALAAENQN